MIKKVLCVDIGGTKTAFSIFDECGNELFYNKIKTQPDDGPNRLADRVLDILKPVLNGVSVGVIASPGPLDLSTGKIKHIATMGWENVPIISIFSEKFKIPFFLINDCDAGALGVKKYVDYSNIKTLCYISVSTGIGGGIVNEGRLLTGRGNAANFGHIPVRGEGLVCGCGKKDCLELYASGSGIECRYEKKTGRRLPCAEIAVLARNGDIAAKEIFSDAEEKFIFAISVIVATIDPDTVVFGGSVCNAKDLFLDAALKKFPQLKTHFILNDGKQVLYGAFYYALSQ